MLQPSPLTLPRITRLPVRRKDEWLAVAVAALLFGFYAVFSVRRHRLLLTSGYDLGIFEQEVRSYAHGGLPVSDLKGPGFPLLGDHFSPVTATIAPFYRMFPSPVTLLVAQAFLFALAAVPIVRFGLRRLGPAAAVVVGLAFGLSWGVADAVGFDFHEIAFAVPLLSASAVAFAEHRLRAALCWALPLVLVKEDLGLTVALIGLLVARRGARVAGVRTAVFGIAATATEMLYLIPHFNPAHRNDYLPFLHGTPAFHPHFPLGRVIGIATLVALLAPTAFLAVRSTVVLFALPTLLWRFAAANPAYWVMRFHYNAVLMPILFVAFVDALHTRPHRRRYLVVGAAVTLCLLPLHPFGSAAELVRTPSAVAAERRLLDGIPARTTVAASNWIAPQLTARDQVSLFTPDTLGSVRPRYIVVDLARSFPLSVQRQRDLAERALRDGYQRVDAAGDVVLLERSP